MSLYQELSHVINITCNADLVLPPPGLALIFAFCILIQTLMSASSTMEVANTTAMTQMEVTHVPAIMDTDLTVLDIFVKVGKIEI